jgi:hypothetical protein
MTRNPTPGEIAYTEDVRRRPTYHTGEPRPAWAQINDWAKTSWERNPTPRDWPTPTKQERPAPCA